MNFRRRELVAGAAALIVAPRVSFAATDIEFTPELIHDNLAKSIWLSTNREATRAAYVMAAPWCPFCRQLYLAQAEVNHDIDYRFVFMGFRKNGDAVANAFFSKEKDQVGLFYADPGARNDALSDSATAFIDEVNTVTGHKMAKAVGAIVSGSGGSGSGTSFAYPTTVFYNGQNKLQARLGGWDNVEQLSDEISASAAVDAVLPVYPDLVRSAPRRKSLNRQHFADKANTFLYSAPTTDAPKVDLLGEGSGYSFEFQASVDGEDWIGTRPFNGYNGLMWGRKAQFFTQ